MLRDHSMTEDIRIDWSVIDPDRVEAINHDQLAGLQIADAVASSVFYAVNLNPYGEAESRYLELLTPTIYRHRDDALGYGLKFWPSRLSDLRKTLEHLAVFERFGRT